MGFSNLKRPDSFSESAIRFGMFKTSCLVDILLCIFLGHVPVLCWFQGCSTRKFQPKLKVQNAKENSTVSILPPDEAGYVEPSRNADFDPYEFMYIDEGTILTFSSNDVLGCSSMIFGKFISPDPTTSKLPTNEE